jgi:hypothetical protein
VYLDADMIVLRNMDHLFALGPGFFAVGDCYGGREFGGWLLPLRRRAWQHQPGSGQQQAAWCRVRCAAGSLSPRPEVSAASMTALPAR